MFQASLFWYLLFLSVYFGSFANVTDFKKFFFYTEIVWISVFVSLLGLNLTLNNPLIFTNCFFILVFTACEAVVMASILLISLETGSESTISSDKL